MRRQEPITIELGRADYRIDGKRRASGKFDRSAILKRAHVLKHELRAQTALATFKAETRLDAMNRPWHPRTLEVITAETRLDFGAALRASWAEAHVAAARRERRAARKAGKALTVGKNALAIISNASPSLAKLLASVTAIAVATARWADQHFMASRQPGAALPVIHRIQ